MKFAASLIAIGASAIKLHQEDEAHPVQRMIDWNGDGLIQREEAKDQAYIFYATGYIDEDDLAEAIDFYDDDEFPDEFTFDDVWDYVEETGDQEVAEGFAEFVEFSENVVLDMAANAIFDEVDADGNDVLDIDEAADFIVENFSDEEEQDEVIDGFVAADEDGSGDVDRAEFLDAMIYAIHEEEGVREEVIEEIADFIDMFDVDCEGEECRAIAEEFDANADYPQYGEGFYERWYGDEEWSDEE